MRAGDGVHLALGAARSACRGANGIARFLRQQRLVAPHGVERAQAAFELGGELVGADLHGGRRGGSGG